jgi:hypothetical protein
MTKDPWKSMSVRDRRANVHKNDHLEHIAHVNALRWTTELSMKMKHIDFPFSIQLFSPYLSSAERSGMKNMHNKSE